MPATGANPDARQAALEVVRALQAAGHCAYWVGGCVRDMLLGRPPVDYDVATSARPEQVEACFRRTIPVGRQFGVVLVRLGGQETQVATFRAEADYADGRHPAQVRFADARADAVRRDFTINGLFFDPVTEACHDWVGGRPDIAARRIRTIGNPVDRFEEDHLRLLRGVRFAAELDFALEPGTMTAIQRLAPSIRRISAERIRDELLKLLRPPHAQRGLILLRDSGLLSHVMPEVAAFSGCEQSPDFHPEGDVFEHVSGMLGRLENGAPPLLAWAVLLHDVAKPVTASRDLETGRIRFFGHERIGADMAETILRRLRFPVRELEQVTTAVRHHMQFKDAPRMRKATLRRMLLRPTFPLELELHRLDCLGSHGQLETWNFVRAAARELAAKPEVLPPLLTGHDLMTLGVAPGPEMGRLLAEVRDRQLGEELTAKEEALEWVRNCLRQA
ncbi:MAG: CCA tRNA nucleotidyltransferase [Verrucomicrobiae bacterium]|nr:CCA tRNA nucleotidyltransferase [Verrucomicrobiae bacterium]